ncbi:MAG: hypothetical protein F6J94_32535, partial [Moorea sp. SIO1F2]|nr:hypothetical protein [Moorena sp. SIO1F2]
MRYTHFFSPYSPLPTPYSLLPTPYSHNGGTLPDQVSQIVRDVAKELNVGRLNVESELNVGRL